MKKQDIFDTTLSLIVSKGLHDTPMSQIASQANVAIGTIYHHFKNKEELIQALYADIHSELDENVAVDEVDINNYRAEFTSLFLRAFKYFVQNPAKFHFLRQYENSPFGLETDELNSNIEFPFGKAFFQLGVERGLLKPVSPSLISNIVYSNITNLVRLHLAGKTTLNKELIQLVIDGCWEMVKG